MKKIRILSVVFLILIISIISCKKTEKAVVSESKSGESSSPAESGKFIDENTYEQYTANSYATLVDNTPVYKEPDETSEVIYKNDNIKEVNYKIKRYQLYDKYNVAVWYNILIDNISGWVKDDRLFNYENIKIKNFKYGIIKTAFGVEGDGPPETKFSTDSSLRFSYKLIIYDDKNVIKEIVLKSESVEITEYFYNVKLSLYYGIDILQINIGSDHPFDTFGQILLYSFNASGIPDKEILSWWDKASGQFINTINLIGTEMIDKSFIINYSFDNFNNEPKCKGTIKLYYDFDLQNKRFVFNKLESDINSDKGEKLILNEDQIRKFLNFY